MNSKITSVQFFSKSSKLCEEMVLGVNYNSQLFRVFGFHKGHIVIYYYLPLYKWYRFKIYDDDKCACDGSLPQTIKQ